MPRDSYSSCSEYPLPLISSLAITMTIWKASIFPAPSTLTVRRLVNLYTLILYQQLMDN